MAPSAIRQAGVRGAESPLIAHSTTTFPRILTVVSGELSQSRGQLHHDQRPGPGDADRVLSVNAEALFSWRDP